MGQKPLEPWALKAVVDEALQRAASQIRDVLKEMSPRLQPFPAFMGMTSIQAIEVEPQGLRSHDRGCVVVCPDGELYELSLQTIPGPPGVSDADQVEGLERLELPPEEYVTYGYAAVKVIAERLEND